MDSKFIWIPDGEDYGGYTDRHVILSNTNLVSYLNIMNNMIFRSNEYFLSMMKNNNWNLEKLIKFHLNKNNINHLVKFIPYIMYSVRNKNGSTRWAKGTYHSEFGYYIKYNSEYKKSSFYKEKFHKSKLSINEFYKQLIYL